MFDNCLTIPVELRRPQLTSLHMNEQTISTREFLRNYKKFSTAKQVIIIENHGKPEGVYMPYPEWEKKSENKRSRCFTQEDLDKYTKNLPGFPSISNKEIDDAVYKYPNKINKSRKK